MSNEHYFGTHIHSGTHNIDILIESTEKVREVGGNLVQIFLTLPGEMKTVEQCKSNLTKYKNYLEENNLKVVIHSSYLHNMARDWDSYSWWLKNIETEIKYAYYIGAFGLVIHLGKKLELTKEEAYNNMYSSLINIHNRTKEYHRVKILIETSTGQGSEVCYELEELAHFYKKFSKNENKEIRDRFKICLDTCHVFSAGYNLKTKEEVKLFLETFEELIGIKNIELVHLNDCKVDVGSKKDRHDNIGKGFIGFNSLSLFFNYFKKLGIPIILETPGGGYKTEIPLMLNK